MFKVKKLIILLFEQIIRLNFIHIITLKRIFTPTIKNTLKNKIAFVNTYDIGGGAAKIARQLAQNLTYSELNSIRLYVKTKKSSADWVFEIESAPYNFLDEVLRREAIQKGWIEFTGFHAKKLFEDPFFKESSIVHIHNLHGEFFSPILFKSLFNNKKVIWTLHDESFITGHCSCTLGCDRWQIGCGSCPDLTIYPPVKFDNTKEVLIKKKKWITELQPIVVCPSHWLAERVKIAYPNLKSIQVIPNGVNTDLFYPKDKNEIREFLCLPKEKKIVLFVSEFATQNPFKGGSILREIILDNSFSDVIFVTVGGKHEGFIHNHICYPYIEDENELANLYAACDVLLYPTQADNLPLVVLESMACGTPVIASEIGGIPEIIEHDVDGLLVKTYNSSIQFKKCLQTFLKLDKTRRSSFSINSRNKVFEKFSLGSMYLKYNYLYFKSNF